MNADALWHGETYVCSGQKDKIKTFPLQIIFKMIHDGHIVASQLCYSCFFPLFVYPSKSNNGLECKWDPAEEKPCNTFVSCFINIQQSFSVVANARGVNKVEWIQEVACQMEFISRDSFGVNCVLATELLHQLCRANAAVLSEWGGSEQSCNAATVSDQ